MKRLIKLFILCLISTSVYFIYKDNNDTNYTITNIGDKLSQGINSYGIRDYSYIDYYKEQLKNMKKKININHTYSNSDQTISLTLKDLKDNPNLKRILYDTDKLFLTLGYNDLLYSLATTENINQDKLDRVMNKIQKDYKDLIREIKKYYHEEIIVIGYYPYYEEDYYKQEGIKKLNNILKNEDVTFIDTYDSLKNRKKYFNNPKSYFPNHEGYKEISKKIILKTLEKKENI